VNTSTRIVILYNSPAETGPLATAYAESDAGVLNEVAAAEESLTRHGFSVRRAGVRRLGDIPPALAAGPERLVFNLVERLDDSFTAFNFVPAVCEALGRSCTGGSSDALSLTLDKWIAKARLKACGVGVADAVVLAPGADMPDLPPFPLIVKPAAAGGSEGIDAALSIVKDTGALLRAATRIHEQFDQPALAERFIEGREFNLSVIERNGRPEVMPVAEIDFSLFPPDRPHIVDYAVKWIPGTIPGHVSPRKVPADIDAASNAHLRSEALKAWLACGCRDYARIDFRMDRDGRTYVLEVNVNPDISPLAGLPAALKAAAIPYDDFILAMVANARARLAAIEPPSSQA
jgi:D-alanine-D-alanine ligase